MTAIDDIERAIRENLAAGAPLLLGTPITSADSADLLADVLDPGALSLASPRIERDGDTILVHGAADLFGRASLDVALGFEIVDDEGVSFVLRAALSDLPALAALAASIETPQLWWSIGPLGETFEDVALPAISDLYFTTMLKIGEARLPIIILPPAAGEAAWRVEGTALRVPLPRLDAVAAWLGLDDLGSLIPPPLASLGGMVITGIGVVFRPGQAALDSASVTLATPAAWAVAGGKIAVEDLAFSLGYAHDPESTQRSVNARVSGTLRLGGQSVDVMIGYDATSGSAWLDLLTANGIALPSLNDLAAFIGEPRLLDGLPAPLATLSAITLTRLSIAIDAHRLTLDHVEMSMAVEIPLGLPGGLALDGTRLSLAISPGAGDAALSGWADAMLAGAGSPIPLQAILQKDLEFSGSLTELRLVDIANALIPNLPPALTKNEVTLENIYVSVSSAGHLDFDARASFDFHALAHDLEIPLPDGLASVTLDRLALQIDVAAGSWSVSLATAAKIQLPDGGKNHLAVSDIGITIAHDGSAGTTLGCRFVLDGSIALSADVSLAGHGIACSWQSGASGDWKCAGTIDVNVLGNTYAFAPRIEKGRFELRYLGNLTLADWPDLATVHADGLTVSLAKTEGGHDWSLAGAAVFDVVGLRPATGTVNLAKGEFEITADVPEVPRIDLPLPTVPPPSILIDLQPLRLRVAGAAKGGLAIEAGATVTPRHIPVPADVVFPNETMGGSLRVDERGFTLTFMPPGSPTIDVTFAKGTAMEVHFRGIDVKTLRLDRLASGSDAKKRDWRLGADLNVSGLAQLNRLFHAADLFNDSVDLIVSLGTGLAVQAQKSPFKPVKFRADNPAWTEWLAVGGAGTFSFEVPEFAFDFKGGRWRAKGGIERRGPLAIPLKPIKWLLEQGKFPTALLDRMPDGIPIQKIDFTSAKFADQIVALLGHVDPSAKAVFARLAGLFSKGIERLPDRLRDYFVIDIPQGLTLDMAVEPAGGFAFEVAVPGEKPLKVLLPAVLGVTPGLMGLTVHRLSFGLTGGGSVAVLKTDGWADWHDAFGLIFALITGKGGALTNRLTMRDTVALVPTAMPLPVPLFYGEFGWDYRDPFGFALAYHANFPDPQPSVQAWFALIGELIHFFREEGYYLHDKGVPDGMAMQFNLEKASLSLPSYLGGASLGVPEVLPPLPVTETLARALDGIKAGNGGWIIQSIPLKWPKTGKTTWIRVGHETIGFGPLSITAAWCITTKDEFVNEVLKDDEAKAMLAVANAESMLDSLPEKAGGKSYDKGFVILLMGGLAAKTPLADIFTFTCQFGIASMSPKDFETGVRLQGRFGPGQTLVLGIEGRIQTQDTDDGASIAVSVDGSIYLIVAGQRLELAAGLNVIPGRSFEGYVTLALSEYVSIGGTLTIDASGAAIEGHVQWRGTEGSSDGLRTGARFGEDGVLFVFTLNIGAFGCDARLQLPGKNPGDVFIVAVTINLPPSFVNDFKAGLKTTANEVVEDKVTKAFDDLQAAVAQIGTFEASLRGLQDWLPGFCEGIIRQIQSAVTNKSVDAALNRWAGKNLAKKAAVAVIKGTARSQAHAKAQPWIDKLKSVQDAAGHALDESYRIRLQAALRSLTDSNEIVIRIGGIGKVFTGVTVFTYKPVLNTENKGKINQAIEAIDKLPEASRNKVSAETVLAQFPRRQQVLAEVRHAVDTGIGQIPAIHSVGFETSVGFLNPGKLDLSAELEFGGKTIPMRLTVDLTRPDRTAKAIASAFANAF